MFFNKNKEENSQENKNTNVQVKEGETPYFTSKIGDNELQIIKKKTDYNTPYYELKFNKKILYGVITSKRNSSLDLYGRFIDDKNKAYFVKIIENKNDLNKYEDLEYYDKLALIFNYLLVAEGDIEIAMKFIKEFGSNKYHNKYEVVDNSTMLSDLEYSSLKAEDNEVIDIEDIIYNYENDNRQIVGYEYAENKLYNKVSLNIEKAYVTGIIGSMGSSKTVLANNLIESSIDKYKSIFVVDSKISSGEGGNTQSDYTKILLKDNHKVDWSKLQGNYVIEENKEKISTVKYDMNYGNKEIILFEYSGNSTRENNPINPFLSPYYTKLIEELTQKKLDTDRINSLFNSHNTFVKDTLYYLISMTADDEKEDIPENDIETFISSIVSSMKVYIETYKTLPDKQWDVTISIASMVTDDRISKLLFKLRDEKYLDWYNLFILPTAVDMEMICIFKCNEKSAQFLNYHIEHWYSEFFMNVYKENLGGKKRYLTVKEEFDKYLSKKDIEELGKPFKKKLARYFSNKVSQDRSRGMDSIWIVQSLDQVPRDIFKLIRCLAIGKLSQVDIPILEENLGKNKTKILMDNLTDANRSGLFYITIPMNIDNKMIKESRANKEYTGKFIKVLPKLGQFDVPEKIENSHKWSNKSVLYNNEEYTPEKYNIHVEKPIKNQIPAGIRLDNNGIAIDYIYFNKNFFKGSKHSMYNGVTRSGKGVYVCNEIGQISYDTSNRLIIFDTKGNEWMSVLKQNEKEFDYKNTWNLFKNGDKNKQPVYDEIYSNYLNHFELNIKKPIINTSSFTCLHFSKDDNFIDYNSTIYIDSPHTLITFIKGIYLMEIQNSSHFDSNYYQEFQQYLSILEHKMINDGLDMKDYLNYPNHKVEEKTVVGFATQVISMVEGLLNMKFITFDSKKGLDINKDILNNFQNLVISSNVSFVVYIYNELIRPFLLENKDNKNNIVICEEASDYMSNDSRLYTILGEEIRTWLSKDTSKISYKIITQLPEQLDEILQGNIEEHIILRYKELPESVKKSLGKDYDKIDLLLNISREFKIKLLGYNDSPNKFVTGYELEKKKKSKTINDNRLFLILPPMFEFNEHRNPKDIAELYKTNKILHK